MSMMAYIRNQQYRENFQRKEMDYRFFFDENGNYIGDQYIQDLKDTYGTRYQNLSYSEQSRFNNPIIGEGAGLRASIKYATDTAKQIQKLRDRGFSDQEISKLAGQIYADPDKYIGGSKYLPQRQVRTGSKYYAGGKGDQTVFFNLLTQYLDEAARSYDKQKEMFAQEQMSQQSEFEQAKYDESLRAVSSVEDQQASFEQSEKERQAAASDAYIRQQAASSGRQTEARNPYLVIKPQERPV